MRQGRNGGKAQKWGGVGGNRRHIGRGPWASRMRCAAAVMSISGHEYFSPAPSVSFVQATVNGKMDGTNITLKEREDKRAELQGTISNVSWGTPVFQGDGIPATPS